MEKLLKQLKRKEIVWRVLSISLCIIMCVCLICGAVAWIIGNDDLGAISMMICLPLLFSIGGIIGHWTKINGRKAAADYCVKNPDGKSDLFYQLAEKFL